ncbi:MAG: hypothetical protein ACXACK_16000 [Candidatus Hodarchaeales archaeon]
MRINNLSRLKTDLLRFLKIGMILLSLNLMVVVQGLPEGELPNDQCPFSQDDIVDYSIWGEWEGLDSSLDYGNNTGVQSLSVVNRTATRITFFEEKAEIVSGVYNGTPGGFPIDVSSHITYNSTTRRYIGLDAYAWMWISVGYGNITTNSKMNIMSYVFEVVGRNQFNYSNQLRSVWVTTHNKTFNDTDDAYHTNEYELWFDTNTGLMLYYIVRFNAYDNQGRIIEWAFYSIGLENTTIDLTLSYLPPPTEIPLEFFLISSLLVVVTGGVIVGVIFLLGNRK